MKVLFAVDGSAGSLDAVGQVARLLTAGKDEVALYCAPPSSRLDTSIASQDVLARAQQSFVDALFGEATDKLPAGLRPHVHTITDTHDARYGIVSAADAWGADLLVVGARGLGTLGRLLLGSVSRAVVHSAKIPVWVARPARSESQGFNLLLASETAEQGSQAAEIVCSLNWPKDSTCRTITAVTSMFSGQVPEWLEKRARSPDVDKIVQTWAREHDEELRSAREQMEEFTVRLAETCHCAEPIVVEGEPADAILAAVDSHNIDLVAVGAHRKNWLTSTLLGSTSAAVLNHAGCSVLVVPHVGEA